MKVFDAHLHIIDPRFPLQINQGFRPEPFSVDEYLAKTEELVLAGGAIVSGSFQGFDQQYLTDALEQLGDSFVGVTQLPPNCKTDLLRELDNAGVRAARFNLKRGMAEDIDTIEQFARRIYETVGWHAEFYLTGSQINKYAERIEKLPVTVIDHLGLDTDGHDTLIELARLGTYVKATGFGRIEFDPEPIMRRIADANPDVLLFGTDLPGTRARRPFDRSDVDRLKRVLTLSQFQSATVENAVRLYLRDP